jgi:hypothetical protein
MISATRYERDDAARKYQFLAGRVADVASLSQIQAPHIRHETALLNADARITVNADMGFATVDAAE